jgi:hypothetical protein
MRCGLTTNGWPISSSAIPTSWASSNFPTATANATWNRHPSRHRSLHTGDGKRVEFVTRRKRMVIDGKDQTLDSLFYPRRLRRLVAVASTEGIDPTTRTQRVQHNKSVMNSSPATPIVLWSSVSRIHKNDVCWIASQCIDRKKTRRRMSPKRIKILPARACRVPDRSQAAYGPSSN